MRIEVKLRRLTPIDKCDNKNCSCRAGVLVKTHSGLELTFCLQHAADHAKVIVRNGYRTTSEGMVDD